MTREEEEFIRAALAGEAYTRFTRADVRALLDEIDRLRKRERERERCRKEISFGTPWC